MWIGEGEVAPGGGSASDPPATPVVDPIVQLLAAVSTFCERPDRHLSPGDLGQELVALRHVCHRLELEFSVGAARFAATEESEDQGSVIPIDWIRHQCKMSGHAASERVCVGEE